MRVEDSCNFAWMSGLCRVSGGGRVYCGRDCCCQPQRVSDCSHVSYDPAPAAPHRPPLTRRGPPVLSLILAESCYASIIFRVVEWHSHLTKGIFAKNQAQVETTCVKELHTQARICCNSKAACIGYTIGPNWACPGISVSQSEKSFTNEKVTFYKPLYVYTLCEPIGGVV